MSDLSDPAATPPEGDIVTPELPSVADEAARLKEAGIVSDLSDPAATPPERDVVTPEPPSVADEAARLKDARIRSRGRKLGTLLYAVTRSIFMTLRLKVIHPECLDTGGGGAIFVTWHGRSMLCANLFRKRNYWALISLSRDGEMQNRVFQLYGFQTIRGSTGRGGVRGALQMARKVKEGGVLAFTPDGPRGPTHKVQLGVILMAEKSGAPIIPIGVSASRRILVKSWDSYMIPHPFSRAYMVVGSPILVPSKMDTSAKEAMARRIEIAINSVEREAEKLAGYDIYPPEWPTS